MADPENKIHPVRKFMIFLIAVIVFSAIYENALEGAGGEVGSVFRYAMYGSGALLALSLLYVKLKKVE